MNQDIAGAPGLTWAEYLQSGVDNGMISMESYPGGIHQGVVSPGQVQYTTAYDANILAQAGHTVLARSMNINTGNKVASTQSNLKAGMVLTFVATSDGGNVAGSENPSP